jgi:hypothetical protein
MLRIVLAFLLVVFVPTSSLANPITFRFGGEVVSELPDAYSVFEGGSFILRYSFDPETDDANPGDEQSGFYPGALLGGSLQVRTASGLFVWQIDPTGSNNNIHLLHTSDGDTYAVGADLLPFGGFDPSYFLLQLTDRDREAFTSDDLPTRLPSLGTFEWVHQIQLTFDGQCCSTFGQVTSFSVERTPVPEPSTLTLLLVAGVVLCRAAKGNPPISISR